MASVRQHQTLGRSAQNAGLSSHLSGGGPYIGASKTVYAHTAQSHTHATIGRLGD